MCGVFRVPETDEMLLRLERIYAGKNLLQQCVLEGSAYPGQIVPVLARSRRGENGIYLMQWGFRLPGKSTPVINARSETASRKPLFSAALQNRRCLIPVACYYEWQRGEKEKQKFSFIPVSPAPFYLAGIYQYEQNPILPVFTVLTRTAAPDIAFIHSRMPVVLAGDAADAWLSPDTNPVSLMQHAITTMHIQSCA